MSVALAEGVALRAEIDAVLAAAEAEGGNSMLEVVPPLLPAITPTSAEPERTGRDLQYAPRPGESHEDALARARTSPFVAAAATIDAVSQRGGIVGFATSANALVQQLEQQAAAVSGGNLGHAESVLSVHAVTLDALFNALALKATSTLQTNADATERYLRMALRTQAQCRATLETLAAIKNPPVVFARQANIAAGPQQVNNGVGAPVPPPRTRARSRKKASGPNELLEDGHGQRMDP